MSSPITLREELPGVPYLVGTPLVITLATYLLNFPFWSTLWRFPVLGAAVIAAHIYITHRLSQGRYLPASFEPDMRDMHVIVTGGNIGIGLSAATTMARWGARVVIACRNVEAGQAAARRIINEIGATDVLQVECYELNLASQDSVHKFAEEWKRRHPENRLDVLLNNAGIMMTPCRTTHEGIEEQFGTNHLGHFLLTHLLTDSLTRARGRVVCVSSVGHRFADEAIDYAFIKKPDPARYNPQRAYGWSKAANIMHARALNDRLASSGVTAYSVHPGSVNTNLFSGMMGNFGASILRNTIGWVILKTPQHGADAVLYCCAHPDATPGAYHKDCHVESTKSLFVRNADEVNQLWTQSESMVKTLYNANES